MSVDTVNGGRLVIRNALPQPDDSSESWRLIEELRLGGADGSGPDIFGDVQDIAVDGRGTIYILDVGWREVRVFDRRGRFLRTMARQGDGPGEKRYPGGGALPDQRVVWQPPNRVWVGDGLQQLLLDSLGNEINRFTRSGVITAGGAAPEPLAKVVAGDHRGTVFQQLVSVPRSLTGMEIHLARLRLSPEHDFLAGDTILIEFRSVTRGEPVSRQVGNTTIQLSRARGQPTVVWGIGSGGTAWAARMDAYRFHELAFDGDTTRTVELGTPPSTSKSDDDPGEFESVLSALDVSPEGWLWARAAQEEDAGTTWDVFDNCGRHRSTVATQARVDVQHVGGGGIIHVVVAGELDVDYVLRLRIEGEGGSVVEAEDCPY